MLPNNAVIAAQQIILPYLSNARCVLDATAGNGKDSLFLAQHTPPETTVWAFDVQQIALEKTAKLLAEAFLLEKVRMVQASHDQINVYLNQPLDAVMFNLGYLPGGDHSIVTQPETTLCAFKQSLGLLKPGGMVTLVVYPGHASGHAENEALKNFFPELPQSKYSVLCWQLLNQKNYPPVLYAVEKRREH